MLLEQLSEEIRQVLRLHRCRHKACDCHRARELPATLETLVLLGALTMADLARWIDNARAQKKVGKGDGKMLAFEIKDDVLCQLEEKAALKNAVQELTQALSWLHVSLENLNKTGLKKEAQRLKRLTETASRLQSDLILTRVF